MNFLGLRIIHQESFDRHESTFQTVSVPKQNVEAYHSALVKMERGAWSVGERGERYPCQRGGGQGIVLLK